MSDGTYVFTSSLEKKEKEAVMGEENYFSFLFRIIIVGRTVCHTVL